MIHVTEVHSIGEFRLWIRFSDGLAGHVDLANELDGPMFVPLREAAFFDQVRIDPDIRTVVWPNGADLAPEFLREKITALPPGAHRLG